MKKFYGCKYLYKWNEGNWYWDLLDNCNFIVVFYVM